MTVHAISNVKSAHGNDSRRKTASKTTVLVLALAFTFLILTLPVYVFYAVWYQDEDMFLVQTPEVLANMKLVSTVTHVLTYINSAVNFLLYCFTGTKYRREFLRWVQCNAHTVPSAEISSRDNSQQESRIQLS
ncbi:hypothetical protein ACOMHN_062506 [Nucella lapillus]